jgi:Uma2 family endonuclease
MSEQTAETRTRLTVEAYHQLAEYEAHDVIQLIDGEVVIGEGNENENKDADAVAKGYSTVPPILKHQDIVIAVIGLLLAYVKQHGGKVYTAPTEVYLDAENVYEPDVFYISPQAKCTLEAKRVVGPPDLVVEVLSPSSIKRDRVVKFAAYERNGVGEYWLADPLYNTLEVFTLGQDGSYQRQGLFIAGESFASAGLNGQAVAVDDLLAD